jgi:drug/metabolite transporter (DMT)-like permease
MHSISPRFWLGLVNHISVTSSQLALKYAPQSVVAATGGTTSAWNLVFAAIILQEPWGGWDVVGTVLVCAGCVGVATFGSKETPSYTFDEIIALFGRSNPQFLAFAFALSWWIGLMVLVLVLPEERTGAQMRKLAWGCISGAVGGLFFFVKASLNLLDEPDAWGRWQSWAIAGAAAASSLIGVILLNEGLRRYDAVFITPVYQGVLVLVGSLSGVAFFQELENFSWARIYAFLSSLMLIVVGLWICMMSAEGELGEWPGDESDADTDRDVEVDADGPVAKDGGPLCIKTEVTARGTQQAS